MRRRPLQHGMPPVGGYQAEPSQPPGAMDISSGVLPFLVSGGQSYWLQQANPDPVPDFDPRVHGLQLLCGFYVPRGQVGFIKRVVAAPTVPAFIGDAFRNGLTWWYSEPWPADRYPGDGARANSANGLWSTPLAWEGFFNDNPEGIQPKWYWQVRLLAGDFRKVRDELTNGQAFDPGNPDTWPLTLDVPVPRLTADAIQGSGLGNVEAQRFPVLPGDAFTAHWPVPENYSALLYAWWDQTSIALDSGGPNGGPNELATTVYPIGPSVGQLHGYTQPTNSEAAVENVQFGWGG